MGSSFPAYFIAVKHFLSRLSLHENAVDYPPSETHVKIAEMESKIAVRWTHPLMTNADHPWYTVTEGV